MAEMGPGFRRDGEEGVPGKFQPTSYNRYDR